MGELWQVARVLMPPVESPSFRRSKVLRLFVQHGMPAQHSQEFQEAPENITGQQIREYVFNAYPDATDYSFMEMSFKDYNRRLRDQHFNNLAEHMMSRDVVGLVLDDFIR